MIVYLYVKTHLDTGLKYFGKTTENPFRYKGSGKYWKSHLKVHGYNVSTEVVSQFNLPGDEDLLVEWAMSFSAKNDIAGSPEWANIIPENGLDGRPVGISPVNPYPQSAKETLSMLSKTRWADPAYRAKLSVAICNSWTDDRKSTHSELMKGRPEEDKEAMEEGRSRWHKEQSLKDKPYEWFKGPKSEEHKNSISVSLTGVPKSEEHRKNMSESKKNTRPGNAPKGATWISPGEYMVGDYRITNIRSGLWSVELDNLRTEHRMPVRDIVGLLHTDPSKIISANSDTC